MKPAGPRRKPRVRRKAGASTRRASCGDEVVSARAIPAGRIRLPHHGRSVVRVGFIRRPARPLGRWRGQQQPRARGRSPCGAAGNTKPLWLTGECQRGLKVMAERTMPNRKSRDQSPSRASPGLHDSRGGPFGRCPEQQPNARARSGISWWRADSCRGRPGVVCFWPVIRLPAPASPTHLLLPSSVSHAAWPRTKVRPR